MINTKTQHTMATYRKISPIGCGDIALDELKINSTYSKGHGIYISVTPVKRETHGGSLVSERCVLLGGQRESGMYIFAKQLARKSAKVETAIADALEKKADEIATAYDEGDYGKVKAVVLACAVV